MEVTFMRQDAPTMFFLGVRVYSFGLYAALGMALALITLSLLSRKAKWKTGTAPLLGFLALVLGFVFSRVFYCLLDESLGRPMPLWAAVQLDVGGYSAMGALLGACLGAVAAGWITGQSGARLLDYIAPAFLLFLACERLGEGYIEYFGVSRALSGDLLINSFLAVEMEDGYYLATYLIESFVALVLALVLIKEMNAHRRAGDLFIKFMLLFGATQIILESLRYDNHMTVHAFVRLEQILAMTLLGVAVILLAARNWNKRRLLSWIALISVPLTVGIGVGIEFMIDRTGVSRYLLYAAFILLVSVPAYLGLRLRREE